MLLVPVQLVDFNEVFIDPSVNEEVMVRFDDRRLTGQVVTNLVALLLCQFRQVGNGVLTVV